MSLSRIQFEHHDDLSTACFKYFSSPSRIDSLSGLAQAFSDDGKLYQSNALTAIGRLESPVVRELDVPKVGLRKVHIWRAPPQDTSLLWFDFRTLGTYAFVPNRPGTHADGAAWIRLCPVEQFVYVALATIAQNSVVERHAIAPDDIFICSPRLQSMGSYITGVYHEEASAIALQFGFELLGQSRVINARRCHEPWFTGILPESMRLWDPALDVDWLRCAVSQENADLEWNLNDYDGTLTDLRQMFFTQWHSDSATGFSLACGVEGPESDSNVVFQTASIAYQRISSLLK